MTFFLGLFFCYLYSLLGGRGCFICTIFNCNYFRFLNGQGRLYLALWLDKANIWLDKWTRLYFEPKMVEAGPRIKKF